jgi:hypothetical protein
MLSTDKSKLPKHRSVPTSRRLLALLTLVSGLVGCPKDDNQVSGGAPPPPPTASAKEGACANGGGEVRDPATVAFFPRVAGGYCLDPEGDTRTYGEKAKLDMGAVCTTALDGECEVYIQLGLKRMVALRYVDGKAGVGTVEVYLSQFADPLGAYGMFTKRVIADSDPAETTAPKPLDAGAGGAIGTGRAYVWRGLYLAELQYNNEQESPEALAASSAKILGVLASEIGAKLPGATDKPPAAQRLPTENLIPNGIQFFPKDPFGLTGAGAAAVGYYKDGATRYRLVAIVRDNAEQAKETMKALRGSGAAPGQGAVASLPVLGLGDEGAVLALGEAKSEYVFTRKGELVMGAGDEELGSQPGANGAPKRLTRDEKIARLRSWLSAANPVPVGTAAAPSSSGTKK